MAGASLLALATAQLSPVVGLPRATLVAEQEPLSVLTLRSPGAVIVGGVVSGAVPTVNALVSVQVLASFTSTVCEPAARPRNVFGDVAELNPPPSSCTKYGPEPPVNVAVKVPSLALQLATVALRLNVGLELIVTLVDDCELQP